MWQVDAFYNHWFEFKSWRDFSHEHEHDLEDASDRFERRYQRLLLESGLELGLSGHHQAL